LKSQDNLKIKKTINSDSDKLEALYNEILKRDKIIEKLKEENVVLLRTSLKRSEELHEMRKILEKLK
jgi:hypothetical protein